MQKKLVIIFLFVFCVQKQLLEAQNKTTWVNSLFWEVSGKNTETMYIFGTHHLFESKKITENELILETIKKADIVAGEIVIDSNQIRQMMKMTTYMTLKETSLKKLLSEKEYKETDKILQDLMGIPLDLFAKMKPIVVYQYITMGKYLKSQNKNPSAIIGSMPESMDVVFQEKAREWKKEIMGLESMEAQMKVLYDGYSLERQIELLKEEVQKTKKESEKEQEKNISDVEKLNQLYISQDINEMEAITRKQSTQEEYDLLLKNRNMAWIPTLSNILNSKKKAFVAVGAAHLGGEFGVLNLLKKEGYQIKPITIKIKD
jgi:uncharacterized protein YbaP (TraB family)